MKFTKRDGHTLSSSQLDSSAKIDTVFAIVGVVFGSVSCGHRLSHLSNQKATLCHNIMDIHKDLEIDTCVSESLNTTELRCFFVSKSPSFLDKSKTNYITYNHLVDISIAKCNLLIKTPTHRVTLSTLPMIMS